YMQCGHERQSAPAFFCRLHPKHCASARMWIGRWRADGDGGQRRGGGAWALIDSIRALAGSVIGPEKLASVQASRIDRDDALTRRGRLAGGRFRARSASEWIPAGTVPSLAGAPGL